MDDILYFAPSLLVGAVLGTIFFYGLWLTVQKGITSSRPSFWFIGSTLLRTGIALAGFSLVVQGGHWERLLACLAGFIVARYVVTLLTRRTVHCTQEADHAH